MGAHIPVTFICMQIKCMYSIAPTADQAMLEIQSDLVALQKALVDFKWLVIAPKTKCVLFSNSHRDISDGLHIYALDGSLVEQAAAYKYLGIWISTNVMLKKHMDELDTHWAHTLVESMSFQ